MEGQANSEPTRLLLLDDHVLFRESLARLLDSEPDMRVVGHCGTCREALEVMGRGDVDVVLLDFKLGQDGGHEFLTMSREAGYRGKVLIVTAGMSAADSLKALQLGASGIFLKNHPPDRLLQAIRLVAGGDAWIDQRIVELLAGGGAARGDSGLRTVLTPREREVLDGVLDGMTNKRISEHLGVSEGTVKATLQQLFQKAGVHTRSQLVRAALDASFSSGGKRASG